MTEGPPLPTAHAPYPLTDAKSATVRVETMALWVGYAVSYGADNKVWVFPPIGAKAP